jgi:hypothetical protein
LIEDNKFQNFSKSDAKHLVLYILHYKKGLNIFAMAKQLPADVQPKAATVFHSILFKMNSLASSIQHAGEIMKKQDFKDKILDVLPSLKIKNTFIHINVHSALIEQHEKTFKQSVKNPKRLEKYQDKFQTLLADFSNLLLHRFFPDVERPDDEVEAIILCNTKIAELTVEVGSNPESKVAVSHKLKNQAVSGESKSSNPVPNSAVVMKAKAQAEIFKGQNRVIIKRFKGLYRYFDAIQFQKASQQSKAKTSVSIEDDSASKSLLSP